MIKKVILRNGVQSNKWSKIIKFKLHPHQTQKKASNNTSRYDGFGLLQIANYTKSMIDISMRCH